MTQIGICKKQKSLNLPCTLCSLPYPFLIFKKFSNHIHRVLQIRDLQTLMHADMTAMIAEIFGVRKISQFIAEVLIAQRLGGNRIKKITRIDSDRKSVV